MPAFLALNLRVIGFFIEGVYLESRKGVEHLL